MSSLRQQLIEMQQQLDLSVQASKATMIIEKCGIVLSKTDTVAGHYSRLKSQYTALQRLPPKLRVDWSEEQRNQLKNAANSVNNLQSQWSRWLNNQTQAAAIDAQNVDEPLDKKEATQESTAYDIIQNDSLTNCVNLTLSLHRTLSDQLKSAWEEWLQVMHQQIHVDSKTLDAQQKVDKYKAIADEYLSLRSKYDLLIQSLPENGERILQITGMSDQLHSLREAMNTDDWPEAVRLFFDRINGPLRGRPTLSTLTPEVLHWLQNEDMLEDFVITRK
ncbi:hypothetical protein [Enterobacter sp.]|uniref:hypothetical protein n=1 Tax=Enterobacter sp. TaxID=42895 RepID=UPI00296F93BB|nr:hypothetical protein [Enterobacter sp.]